MSEKDEKEQSKQPSTSEKITEKTGYEPKELLKAPIEPPKEVKNPREPSQNQKITIVTGIILFVIGLILWGAISFWAFVVLAFAAAALIAFGGMVRT